MPAKKISNEDIELLKNAANKGTNGYSKEKEQQLLSLLSNAQNAGQIIKSLTGDELYNLIGKRNYTNLECIGNWSVQSKIQLVNKNAKFFSDLPFTFADNTLRDQELLKACIKAMNAQYPSSVDRYLVYRQYFGRSFSSSIVFEQETFELFFKSLPQQSPFIFEEYPFKDIRNWRQFIKSNQNFALQNRMLDAMENVNFFSKSSLLKFKEQNDDLLRTKIFYNHFIQSFNRAVNDKIDNQTSNARFNRDFAELDEDYAAVYEAEDDIRNITSRFDDLMKFVEEEFGTYKDIIMQQDMTKKAAANKGSTAQ